MTLAHGTDRLESARLVLRRIAPDDLPFFTRIHALPEVIGILVVLKDLLDMDRASRPDLSAYVKASEASSLSIHTRAIGSSSST